MTAAAVPNAAAVIIIETKRLTNRYAVAAGGYQHRHDEHYTRRLNPYHDDQGKHHQKGVVDEVGA